LLRGAISLLRSPVSLLRDPVSLLRGPVSLLRRIPGVARLARCTVTRLAIAWLPVGRRLTVPRLLVLSERQA
jgi:hypothetical protein